MEIIDEDRYSIDSLEKKHDRILKKNLYWTLSRGIGSIRLTFDRKFSIEVPNKEHPPEWFPEPSHRSIGSEIFSPSFRHKSEEFSEKNLRFSTTCMENCLHIDSPSSKHIFPDTRSRSYGIDIVRRNHNSHTDKESVLSADQWKYYSDRSIRQSIDHFCWSIPGFSIFDIDVVRR